MVLRNKLQRYFSLRVWTPMDNQEGTISINFKFWFAAVACAATLIGGIFWIANVASAANGAMELAKATHDEIVEYKVKDQDFREKVLQSQSQMSTDLQWIKQKLK